MRPKVRRQERTNISYRPRPIKYNKQGLGPQAHPQSSSRGRTPMKSGGHERTFAPKVQTTWSAHMQASASSWTNPRRNRVGRSEGGAVVVGEATYAGQQARLHMRHAWREEPPPVRLKGAHKWEFLRHQGFPPSGHVLSSFAVSHWCVGSSFKPRGRRAKRELMRILGAELKF